MEFKDEYIYSTGDSLDFLKEVPDKSVKLVITSPPYNIGKSYEKKVKIEDYLENQKEIISELNRVLRDDGSICWQVGNFVDKGEVFPLDIYYYDMFKSLGFKLRNRVIWHFGHGLHAKLRFSGRYETVLWFTKSDEYTFNLDDVRVPSKYPGKRHFKGDKKGQLSGNPKGKNPEDVWEFIATEFDCGMIDIPNVKSNHPEKTEHPCQYPIELVERFILALTNENDLVLDPFAGVGTTIIASLKNKRRSIGIEKEKDYVSIGEERISKYLDGSLKMRKLGTKIHKPKPTDKVAKYPTEWTE